MGKAMGREAGKKLLFKRFEQHIPDERFPLCFLYSSNRELGQQFMEETVKQFSLESYNIKLVPVGGVIGTHIGTDGIGFAYVMKETE
ncbi:MAG: DegV family protein, partial [Clostridia bacterium]|nr:DegV family protein [Clostridia bacterium]